MSDFKLIPVNKLHAEALRSDKTVMLLTEGEVDPDDAAEVNDALTAALAADPAASLAALVGGDASYADDYTAAAGGIAINQAYRRSTGLLAWRPKGSVATIALFGDSITAQGASGLNSILGDGYWSHARVMNRSAWDPKPNGSSLTFATSGYRTDALITAHLANLIAADPDMMVDASGINDAMQSIATATIVANRRSIWSQCRAAGIWPIACEILPATSSASGNSGGAASARIVAANVALKAAALADNVPWVEWASVIELSPGLGSSAYQPDGLHPNPAGAAKLGRVLAATLTAQAEFLTDPFASTAWITAGIPFAGSGMPTGWNSYAASGGSIGTQTTTADPDGLGSWWTIPLIKGSSTDIFTATNSSANTGGSPASKTVDGVAELEVLSGEVAVYFKISSNPSNQIEGTDVHLNTGTLTSADGKVVLRTPRKTVAGDRTLVWPSLLLRPTGDATVRIRRIGVREYP